MLTFSLICFQVAKWFAKLYPQVSFPSTRIPLLITRKESKFAKLPLDQQPAFLEELLDLDCVSPALSAIGLDRRKLLADNKEMDLPEHFFLF